MSNLLPAWETIKKLSPFIAIVLAFLYVRSCTGASEQADRYKDNLAARDAKIVQHKLSNGQLANDKQLLVVTNKELKKQLWIKDDSIKILLEKIKDPVVVVKWRTKYVYDSIYIPFLQPVPCDFKRTFHKTERWYNFKGSVTQDGFSLTDIEIPNTQRLVVGYKKGKPVVSVTNSNPFIKTEEIEGQVIEVPKRHWVIGAGGAWNGYQPPYFGIFAGYKLFEF